MSNMYHEEANAQHDNPHPSDWASFALMTPLNESIFLSYQTSSPEYIIFAIISSQA